jgi:hypothetical protein
LKNTVVRNLSKEGDYTLTVTAIDGTKKSSKDIKITVLEPNSVQDNLVDNVLKIYPIPFTDEVLISFTKPFEFPEINIFNCLGLLIKKLSVIDGFVKWDGKDSSGNNVAAGLYIFSAGTGKNRISCTLIRE